MAKASAISLSKLILVLTSNTNDTIRDTITSGTIPSLSATSTSPQTIAKNYSLKPLRSWKLVATVKDAKDSVIHKDSATTSVVLVGDTAHVSLSLSAKFAMYQANFVIPDSIASATAGTAKEVLHINRLILKIDGVTRKDSSKTYFTGTSVLAYDYVPVGSHTVQLLAYGPMGYWDVSNPLYSGSQTINVGAGSDSTVALNLSWVGPTTGTGNMSAIIGRVGTVTINGTLPSTVVQ
jgi:hypothetical protein